MFVPQDCESFPLKADFRYSQAPFKRGFTVLYSKYGDRGSTVVKVLCYKSEGR